MSHTFGRDAVIVEAVRTPVGKGKASGALHGVHPADLLAHSLRALIERTGIDPALIDDVITGAVTQVDEQAFNIARTALLAAGYPESVPGTTVDRQCGSSQQAVHFAAQGVMSGAYDIVVAAGVESMGRVPMGSNIRPGADPRGVAFTERYSEGLIAQGHSAELIAARWGFDRTAQDEFALSSHAKAYAAATVAVSPGTRALAELDHDEIIRSGGTLESMAGLRPAFVDPAVGERFPQIDWSVTAGNSSPLSDGSAAPLITTSETPRGSD